jgi:hypothetical protein
MRVQQLGHVPRRFAGLAWFVRGLHQFRVKLFVFPFQRLGDVELHGLASFGDRYSATGLRGGVAVYFAGNYLSAAATAAASLRVRLITMLNASLSSA